MLSKKKIQEGIKQGRKDLENLIQQIIQNETSNFPEKVELAATYSAVLALEQVIEMKDED